MKQKEIRPVSKKEAQLFAKTVLENTYGAIVNSIEYVGGGSFGFVYKAEIDKEPFTVIMKACRTDGICAREASELTLLGANSLIKIPKVYFTYNATAEIPIDCKAVYDEWLDFYQPFASDILACARELCKSGKLEKKVIHTMERAWSAFDYIFSDKVETASLIHGDMNVMNIMSDKHLKPLAIIDPLESKWADNEYELFQLRNLTGDKFGLYETYKAKYPVSDKCDIKTSFYALYHEVYAYIISGTKVNFILMPLVKRMNRELDKCNL